MKITEFNVGDSFTYNHIAGKYNERHHMFVFNIVLSKHKTGIKVLRTNNRISNITFYKYSDYPTIEFNKAELSSGGFTVVLDKPVA